MMGEAPSVSAGKAWLPDWLRFARAFSEDPDEILDLEWFCEHPVRG
jgi:hypothetical protein